MKRLLILIALALATMGGAVWAYIASTGTHEPDAWAEPANYSYRVNYMAPGGDGATFDITVRNHSVTAAERVPKGDGPEDESWVTENIVWTLTDIEAKYFEAKKGRESDATIEYDPVTGAPSVVSLDWMVNGADDEEWFQILEYRPEG